MEVKFMENNNANLAIMPPKPTIRKRIKDRREEVKALIDELTIGEIAKRLDVSKVTIYNDIHSLRNQGEIPSKEERARKRKKRTIDVRRNQIKELLGENLDVKAIAPKLGVSIFTIYNDIRFLKEQEEIEGRLKNYITKLKDKTLKEEELLEIEKILEKDPSYRNIIIYVRACTSLKKGQEAINLLRMYINCKNLTEEEREKLKKALKQLEITDLKKKTIEISKGPKIKDSKLSNEMDDMII